MKIESPGRVRFVHGRADSAVPNAHWGLWKVMAFSFSLIRPGLPGLIGALSHFVGCSMGGIIPQVSLDHSFTSSIHCRGVTSFQRHHF